MLALVMCKDKLFVGEVESKDEFLQEEITLMRAIEIREMMVPVSETQVQRMVNFAPLSPFDKTPHNVIIKDPTAVVEIEENSDTEKNYNSFLEQLRAANSGIVMAPAGTGAPIGGKFTPFRK